MNKLLAIQKEDNDYVFFDNRYEWLISDRVNQTQGTDYFANFYPPKMKSVSCIVGENGSGKTTLLNELFDNFLSKDSVIKAWFFLDENKQVICVTSNGHARKDFLESGSVLFLKQEKKLPYQLFFYSAAIESNPRTFSNKDKNKHDLTNTSLFAKKDFSNIIRDEMFNQLNFVLSNAEALKIGEQYREIKRNSYFIDFSDKKIEIVMSEKGQVILDADRYFFPELPYRNISFEVFNTKMKSDGICIEKSTLKKVICYKYMATLGTFMTDEEWDNFFKKKIVESKPENKKSDYKIEYFDLLTSLKEVISQKENFVEVRDALEKAFLLLLKTAESYAIGNDSQRKEVEEVLKNSISMDPLIVDLYSVITLKWQGLSSGEFAFLNMFGRFYQCVSRISGTIQDELLLIIIDEADLGFHPEWQRGWLTIVAYYFDIIFPDKDYQLIISTHSPILLSDFLDKDVTLLRKANTSGEIKKLEEVGKTFGQNIHSLLAHSFFMERTIGEFSYSKIIEISDILTPITEQIETLLSTNTDVELNISSDMIHYSKVNETIKLLKSTIRRPTTEKSYDLERRKMIRAKLPQLDQYEITKEVFLYRTNEYFSGEISDTQQAFEMLEAHINVIGEEFYRGFLKRKLEEMKNKLTSDFNFEGELKKRQFSKEELLEMQKFLAQRIDEQGETKE